MLFARVVFGLPVEGPFDYAVPDYMRACIAPGCRVEVFFGRNRAVGYVVGLAKTSRIARVKNVVRLIDDTPLFGARMLELTRRLAAHYCCSWGELIETSIPEKLRRGLRLPDGQPPRAVEADASLPQKPLLIHDLDPDRRWEEYARELRAALDAGTKGLVLVPDERSLDGAVAFLKTALQREPAVLVRSSSGEAGVWSAIRSGQADIVVGMRSAAFAPLPQASMIVMDEEQDDAYKQDQVPHYHAREVVLMRARLDGARVIFGSTFPSVELFTAAGRGELDYRRIERSRPFPAVKMVNLQAEFHRRRRVKAVLNTFVESAVREELDRKGRTLVFLNRTGFATWAACNNCGAAVKCPQCSHALVLHYAGNRLNCHTCTYSVEPPKVCPECRAGYIKYSGIGLEKLESEMSRLFPQARIAMLDSAHAGELGDADIVLASRSVLKRHVSLFDLVVVLGIDNALNRVDFRASEKVGAQLAGLLAMTDKRMFIQTRLSNHPVFQPLQAAGNAALFYEHESSARKELGLPPYRHLIQVKLRGKAEEKVKAAAEVLFAKLQAAAKTKARVVSLSPGRPARLRGSYYWQVLLSARDAEKGGAFVRAALKGFRHSGVIITVDVDPV